MSEFADFSIHLKPNGMGDVIVNGEDISDSIAGLVVQMRPGQSPVVTLHQLAGSTALSGTGIVQVANPETDHAECLGRFLGGVDPMALEEEVLKRADFDSCSMIVAIEILKEWANGVR